MWKVETDTDEWGESFHVRSAGEDGFDCAFEDYDSASEFCSRLNSGEPLWLYQVSDIEEKVEEGVHKPAVFDAICTMLLMFIALSVFIGLLCKANMWLVICAYWLVLTFKNAALFFLPQRK